MGNTQAEGFAGAVADGYCSLEQALHYQLTANFYPPLPDVWVPACARAIESFNADFDGNKDIRFPAADLIPNLATDVGDDGSFTLSTIDALNIFRLWAFVEQTLDDFGV